MAGQEENFYIWRKVLVMADHKTFLQNTFGLSMWAAANSS